MNLTWSQLRALRVSYWTCRIRTYMTDSEFPQITVPQRMLDKLQKRKTKQALREAEKQRKPHFKSPLIISGYRREFNHHKGQSFNEFDVKKLSSHGWKHHKSKGDYFTIKSHGSNPALQDADEDPVDFPELGLDSGIVDVLTNLEISVPTKIQSLTIPQMLEGHNVICAAETGCGKTYAYLLPMLQNILREYAHVDSTVEPNSPKAIITVPSHELVTQLGTFLEPFENDLNLSVATAIEMKWKEDRQMDILVTTPGQLHKMLKKKHIKVSSLSCLVLDEADTLMDDSFRGLIKSILSFMQIGSSSATDHSRYVSDGVQVALASATYPRGLETMLEPVLTLDEFTVITTDSLHHLMPHVPQKFIRVGADDKLLETAKILRTKKTQPTLVFCNKSDTCYWLSRSLDDMEVKNHLLTGFDNYEERKRFLNSFYIGNCNVLVCTDIASRGLDTNCVQQVINYDFPLFMSDYIHRAGRVGRVGSRKVGHVTSLITHPWDVDLLWKIEIAARKQKELHNVNANIKRKITSVVADKYGGEPVMDD